MTYEISKTTGICTTGGLVRGCKLCNYQIPAGNPYVEIKIKLHLHNDVPYRYINFCQPCFKNLFAILEEEETTFQLH